MRGTLKREGLSGYRDEVTELVKAGEPFGDIEDAIDGAGDITIDQKAALWLIAFSLRDRDEQQREARAHLAAVR
jgi:hypothetical protein